MVKKKKNNNILYFIIGALVVMVLMKGTVLEKETVYITNTSIIQMLQEAPKGTCSISVVPSVTTEGDRVTGTIHDGVTTLCSVYVNKDNTGWNLILSEFTDVFGDYTLTQNIDVAGSYVFRAVCGDCVSNSANLRVNPLAPDDDGVPPADDGADESGDPVVYCESAWPVPFSSKHCSARIGCGRLEVCTYIEGRLGNPSRCECQLEIAPPPPAPECEVNIECLYSHGDGYICYYGTCTEVTADNCMSMALHEGFEIGYWPTYTYDECLEQCDSYCGTCNRASRGGTLGLCCAYSC